MIAACDTFRGGGFEGVRVFNQINADLTPERREAACGAGNKDCIAADGNCLATDYSGGRNSR